MHMTSRMISGVLIVLGVSTLLLLCAGCGGGDGGSASPLISGGNGSIVAGDSELLDGSHGDTYSFTASRNGVVAVSMSGTNVDPYIVIWRGSGSDYTTSTLIGMDDDSGLGSDALVIFEVTANSTYSFRCCTYGADDFGDYKYTVTYLDNHTLLAGDDTGTDKPARTVAEKTLAP